MTTNLLLRAFTAAALSLLLACGGGPSGTEDDAGLDSSSEPASEASASDSEEATDSEVASEAASETPDEVASANPEAAALATAAAVTLQDMGSAYKRFRRAEGVTPYTKDPCDPDVLSTVEAQYDGVMVKHKKEDVWVYSSSYVFGSKAEADEYVDARNGKAWLRCRAQELADYQKENAGKQYSVKVGQHGTTKGTRNVAYAQFVITFKGEPAGAHILRHLFQEGRVVLNVGVEQSGNGASDDLTDVVHDDLASAVDQAMRRVKKSS